MAQQYKIHEARNELTRKSDKPYRVFILGGLSFMPAWEYCAEFATKQEAQDYIDETQRIIAITDKANSQD